MDPSPDKFPVRDKAQSKMSTKGGGGGGGGGDIEAFLRRTAAQEGAAITRLTRDDLEDRYLRIYEDHLVLKRHAHKQEERMKKMATKLMRLVNDKKKGALVGEAGVLPLQLKDVEAQEKVAELEEQVHKTPPLNSNITFCRIQNTPKNHHCLGAVHPLHNY